MSLNCLCPLPTAITTITPNTCPENFGQIQKIAIQRQGFDFDGTTGNDIEVLADWQSRIALSTSEKIQVSPFIYNFVSAAGEAITNGGGDNTTLNGEVELVGINKSAASGMFKSLSSAVINALQSYNCETALGVYFINADGKIIAQELTTGTYTPFPISSFFVGDKTNNGFATKDENALSFQLNAGWSKKYAIVTPAFNPLTAI
jgi:hypothetical protein